MQEQQQEEPGKGGAGEGNENPGEWREASHEGQVYYWHSVTRETRWTNPDAPQEPGQTEEAQGDEQDEHKQQQDQEGEGAAGGGEQGEQKHQKEQEKEGGGGGGEDKKGSYCLCGGPERASMVFCDECKKWFHCDCIGLEADSQALETLPTTTNCAILQHDAVALSKRVAGPAAARSRRAGGNFSRGAGKFVCPAAVCKSRRFGTEVGLKIHVKMIHGKTLKQIYAATQPNSKQRNAAKGQPNSTQRNAAKGQPHSKRCPVVGCHSRSSSVQELRQHVRVKHPDRPFLCPYKDSCAWAFHTEQALNYHIDGKHTQNRPFKCPVGSCTSDFPRRSSLKLHMQRAHGMALGEIESCLSEPRGVDPPKAALGKKKHLCLIAGCGKSFSERPSLDSHILQAHSSVYPSSASVSDEEDPDQVFSSSSTGPRQGAWEGKNLGVAISVIPGRVNLLYEVRRQRLQLSGQDVDGGVHESWGTTSSAENLDDDMLVVGHKRSWSDSSSSSSSSSFGHDEHSAEKRRRVAYSQALARRTFDPSAFKHAVADRVKAVFRPHFLRVRTAVGKTRGQPLSGDERDLFRREARKITHQIVRSVSGRAEGEEEINHWIEERCESFEF